MAKVGRVKYELNLEKVFGRFPASNRDLKEAIAGRAIEMIVDRTQSGLDKNGVKFAKYSAEYEKSQAFKAYGKDKNVDMTLSGDMLGLLDVIDTGAKKIVFGWADETQNAKAFNHTTGDTVPRRDFLGLTSKQLAQLKDEFGDKVAEALDAPAEVQNQQAIDFLDAITEDQSDE